MAMDRDSNLTTGQSSTTHHGTDLPRTGMNTLEGSSTLGHDTGMNTLDDSTTSYDRRGGGSSLMAYLIGGLVIAIGLLAFLFYDGGSTTGRDVNTTSSTTPRLEAPATPTSPATPATPSRPAQ